MSEHEDRRDDEQVPAEQVPAEADDGAQDEPTHDLAEDEPTQGEPADHGVTDPTVAAALERLEGLADRPVSEHVEVYEDVHRVLQESLAEAAGERPER